MKRQKLEKLTICLATVVALFQLINLGSTLSTTPRSLNSSEPNNNNNNSYHEQEQDSLQSQQEQEHPSNIQNNSSSDSQQPPNFFSRESHMERYGSPEGCEAQANYRNACDYYVEIVKRPGDPRNLHFELFRRISEPNKGSWVAVGLSKDKDMGEDDMVECVKGKNRGSSSTSKTYHSWAFAKRQPTRFTDDPDIVFVESSQYHSNNQSLTCKFRRPIKSSVEIPFRPPVEINLERGKYYVLLSVGYTRVNTSDQLEYNGDDPYVSSNLLGYQNSTAFNDIGIMVDSVSNGTDQQHTVSNDTDKLHAVANATDISDSVFNVTDKQMPDSALNGTDRSNITSNVFEDADTPDNSNMSDATNNSGRSESISSRSSVTSDVSVKPQTISNNSGKPDSGSKTKNSPNSSSFRIRSDALSLLLISVIHFGIIFSNLFVHNNNIL